METLCKTLLYVRLIFISQLSYSIVDSFFCPLSGFFVKIDTCSCCSKDLMYYAVRMLFLGLALLIAARPGLDNPGCYKDGWDIFRGICEGITFVLLLSSLFVLFCLWYVVASGLCSIYIAACHTYVGALSQYVCMYTSVPYLKAQKCIFVLHIYIYIYIRIYIYTYCRSST